MKTVNIFVITLGLAVALSVSGCHSDKESDNKPSAAVNKADQKARQNEFQPTKNARKWPYN